MFLSRTKWPRVLCPIALHDVTMGCHYNQNKNQKVFLPCNIYVGLNELEKAHTIVSVALPIPLKPLEFNYFPVMKASMVLRANAHKALVQEQRRLREARAPGSPLRREASCPLTSSGEVGVGPFRPREEGKGNPAISKPKFHLSPSLGKMVWNGLQLPSAVHTALGKRKG